ncbi:hypothetical protein GA0070622_0890 [Micromonospora sediminicola]|uniref:Phage-related minor tail protein n=1 Tax=Micromonospora sediminicola TaxID=946078 RepID=A0A1A9B4U2_9ACTN|nr:hypothetical protein [Micromonospora sediminicola]SBT63922.1 hypothetical protein GA0070622_0890 [Micromonospora sediminicola]
MRTTKVGLDVDERPFVRGMGRAADAAEDLEGALDDVAGSAKDTGDELGRATESTEDLGGSAKDAGRDLDRLRADAARLDRQIDETSEGIRDLARQIAATADEAERAKLSEKLTLERGKQRGQVDLRKLIDFNDDEGKEQGIRYGARFAEGLAAGLARAGGPISSALSAVFGELPPQAQAAIGAGVVAAAAAAAPLVGGAVGGAIVGAAGAGGIVGGIAIAAKHPQVQASAKETGDLFAQTMQRAGVSFVPATLDALGQVRSGIEGMEGDLERAFSATSKYLTPLTDDFLRGAGRAVEGFATAAERAGPAVDALGEIGARVGDVLGDTFEGLSEHSAAGADALLMLWSVFEFGIRSIAGTIEALTAAYGWMEKFAAFISGDVAKLGELVAAQEAAKTSGGGLSDGLQELIGSFTSAGDEAAGAAADIESLDEMMRRMTAENINAEQANLRLEEAIDQVAKAAKDGADKGIDPNTEAGRKNRSALLGMAEAAQSSSEAILRQTGSHEQANAASARARAAFLRAADAMGVEKGEARRLADQLFAIPAKVETKVRALTDEATGQIIGFEKRIRQLDGRVITVRTRITSAGEYIPGVGTQLRRWGGVVEHAQWGRLREAQIAAPVSPARYAWAEPATGGEAFIPRYGDPARSLDILQRAARWYGQQVTPAGAAAGGAQVTNDNRIAVYPQQANWTVHDMEALERRRDALNRLGRPR